MSEREYRESVNARARIQIGKYFYFSIFWAFLRVRGYIIFNFDINTPQVGNKFSTRFDFDALCKQIRSMRVTEFEEENISERDTKPYIILKKIGFVARLKRFTASCL